jgi:hypothetical protein
MPMECNEWQSIPLCVGKIQLFITIETQQSLYNILVTGLSYTELGGWSVSLSEEALWGAWGASSLGTLEDMLRKSRDAGIPACGGPFVVGKPDMRGGVYTKDLDGWMKEGSSGGASLC